MHRYTMVPPTQAGGSSEYFMNNHYTTNNGTTQHNRGSLGNVELDDSTPPPVPLQRRATTMANVSPDIVRIPRQTMRSESTVFSHQQQRTVFFAYKNAMLRVEARFKPQEIVGHGAYGIVCSAFDLKTNDVVCIKKVENVLQSRGIAKRTLREIIFLRHFGNHENIMRLVRTMRPMSRKFHDLYIVSELMETDMACVIRSPQTLSDDHVQFFVYQLLRGTKYIHSADVVHRDLKPRNLLVNANCDLKICDFGLARFLDYETDGVMLSDYVATRWYRAPEIIRRRGGAVYGKPVDMWAIGCIMGELLARKPLFPGKNEIHQLCLINAFLDGDVKRDRLPTIERAQKIGREKEIIHRIRAKLNSLQQRVRTDATLKEEKELERRKRRHEDELHRLENPDAAGFDEISFHRQREACINSLKTMIHGQCNPAALDLVSKLLVTDPRRRLTVEQALRHPYLAELHDPEDEPVCVPIDKQQFAFELEMLSKSQLGDLLLNEVAAYNREDYQQYDMSEPTLFVSRHPGARPRRRRRRNSR